MPVFYLYSLQMNKTMHSEAQITLKNQQQPNANLLSAPAESFVVDKA